MTPIIMLVMLMFVQLLFNSLLKELIPVSCILVLYIFMNYSSFGSELVFVDEYSKNMVLLSLFIFVVMSSFIVDKGKVVLLLLTFSIVMMFFMSSNFVMMFIMFESSLLPVMLLIYMYGVQPERIMAVRYMMMYTTLTSVPLIVSIIYLMNGGLMYLMLEQWSMASLVSPYMLIGLMAAFLTKIPMFMFHPWLPKAHVEAPVEGSMVLAGIMLKMGVFGIIRVITLFYSGYSVVKNFLTMVFLLGSILSCWISISVDDMKMNVAFSSVSHMNFMMAGLFVQKVLSVKSCMLIMISHGLCSALLFFLVTVFYYKTNSRSFIVSKGSMSQYPVLVMLMFMSWVINMACPPSLSFVGEMFCISSMIMYSMILLPLIMVFIIMNSFFCMLSYGVMCHSNMKIQFKDVMGSTMVMMVAYSFIIPSIGMFISLEMIICKYNYIVFT